MTVNTLAPFGVSAGLDLPAADLRWLAAVLQGGITSPERSPEDGAIPAIAAHGLLPRLYVCLRDTPAGAALSPQFRASLASAFQHNAARTFLIENELRRVLDALGAENPIALLKGMAVGRAVYGSPAERPVSDVDLLVMPASLDASTRAFESLGYQPFGIHGQGQVVRWLRRFRAEAPFAGSGAGIDPLLIELHWSLVELPFYVRHIPPAEIWSHVRPLPGLDAGIPDLALLLLHTCAHTAFHHSSDLHLMWLLDVSLLASSPGLDWDLFLARVEAWRLGYAARQTLLAAVRWPGAAIPSAVLAALDGMRTEPVSTRHWGLGDERPGRARRKVWVSLSTLPWRERLPYLAWLGMRAAARPLEATPRRREQAAGTLQSTGP